VLLVGLPEGLGVGVGIAELAVVGGLVDLRDCLEVFIAFVDLAVLGRAFEGVGLQL
jgi:hypothetical protein